MAKINWKPVVDFAGGIVGVAVYGAMIGAVSKVYDYITTDHDKKPVGYDDAVSAIMKSGMWSHDKAEAAASLKPGKKSDYYNAIVHIAKDSSTFSHDKVSIIKQLSEE